jgi:lathosterol oxidase
MDATKIFNLWTGMYLFDLLRYLIPASLAFLIFWVLGKNHWSHLFIQKVFPTQKQLWTEFAYSMSTVVLFSIVGFGIYTAEQAGITLIYYQLDDYGMLYMFSSLILTLIFHDFYFYWTHRLMHHKKLFKYIHRVHHESTNPSPWAAYAFHPWEALIQAMVLPIMVFIFPLHPLTIFIFLTYMIVRNVIGHLGFEIFPKGFTKHKLFNWHTAVTHHNMHHERFNCNYGLYFSWWDKWMKTEDEKYHQTFDEVKSRPKTCKLKSRKKESVTVLILLISSTFINAQNIEGRWTTYNETTGSPLSVIEIVKKGNSLEGKVSKIYIEPYQGEDPVCTKCEGERKDEKVINMNIMWGFKKEGTRWSEGEILDPQSGQVYNSKLWLQDDNTLMLRGYAGILDLFYRTQTWKREGSSKTKSPVGVWNTLDDNWNLVKSQVEIIDRNGELLGFIRKIYLLPHEGTDPVCIACDGKLKNNKIVGLKILYDFKWDGEKWEDGKILDPGNGNVYSSELWLINKDTLKVRGYLGPFYRSQLWKKN